MLGTCPIPVAFAKCDRRDGRTVLEITLMRSRAWSLFLRLSCLSFGEERKQATNGRRLSHTARLVDRRPCSTLMDQLAADKVCSIARPSAQPYRSLSRPRLCQSVHLHYVCCIARLLALVSSISGEIIVATFLSSPTTHNTSFMLRVHGSQPTDRSWSHWLELCYRSLHHAVTCRQGS